MQTVLKTRAVFRILALMLGALVWLASISKSIAAAEDDAKARPILARAILSEGAEQTKLVIELGEINSDFARKVLNSWPRDEVFIFTAGDGTKTPILIDETRDSDGKGKALRIDNGDFLKNEKGEALKFMTSDFKPVDTDSKLRTAIKNSLDLMTLADPNPESRRSAVMKLGMTQKSLYLPVLKARIEKEKSPRVQGALQEAIAIIQLNDADPKVQTAAIGKLAEHTSISSLDLLKRFAANPKTKSNPELARATDIAIKTIEGHIFWVDFFGTIFRGLSLGSILLVVALGLAITFGLMGVINMAHGEIMVVGGYASYVVQNLFLKWFGPSSLEYYFIVAIPVAFLSAALVGILLEQGVIRFLYKRPLESLLATWGVSLVLQQVFRMVFGAANVQVNSPSWLSSNFTIGDVIFGYNRLFVIGFAIVIMILTWMLLTKTPLGLLIRAVMQNRNMAACMGVPTERVNMMTFAFGSGLAGLAGAFLSQIGNVGPSLGQTYIVDCFMTVVVGGVGNIMGTVCSALGIGVSDQILQQVLKNPVMGKITVLAAIILFLQWRPAGLFVTKSRSLEG